MPSTHQSTQILVTVPFTQTETSFFVKSIVFFVVVKFQTKVHDFTVRIVFCRAVVISFSNKRGQWMGYRVIRNNI